MVPLPVTCSWVSGLDFTPYWVHTCFYYKYILYKRIFQKLILYIGTITEDAGPTYLCKGLGYEEYYCGADGARHGCGQSGLSKGR